MKISKLLVPLLTVSLISACGGSSSGGSSNNSGDTGADVANTSPDATDAGTGNGTGNGTGASGLLTGRFVDSAVVGLQYTTATQSGLTGADGSFSYQQGETITFSIGDISLPEVPAAEVHTPLSVFSTDDISDIRVINLARLLQTLDTDGVPENGITLSEAATASATGLNVDFSSAAFDTQVGNLVANSGSSTNALIEGMQALIHLQETLFQEGIEDRPAIPTVQEPDPQNTVANSLVGRSVDFTPSPVYGITGTLTVLDDRTLEVSNFNYNSFGPSVFFYYGTDGNYVDGGPLGTRLNGTVFQDETIRLTLPDNLTLDDFNGISVWCDIFLVNFSDAQF